MQLTVNGSDTFIATGGKPFDATALCLTSIDFAKQDRVLAELERVAWDLVIIDEAIVMFGMQDPVASGSELTIMVVDHPSLAAVLRTAFNAYWEQGVDFDEAAGRDEPPHLIDFTA